MRALPRLAAAVVLATASVAAAQSSPLAVDVRSRAVRPGEVLEITVRAEGGFTAMAATLGDRGLHLWKLPDGRWRVLAGLDVEQAPGRLALTVIGTRAGATPVSQIIPLEVVAASFPERHLTVPPQFVEPPASERPRIEREAIRLRAIYETVSQDRVPDRFGPPVRHRRSSSFGGRSVFNGVPRDRHAGLDFASPAGAAIRAPAAGRVVLVDDLYFTGKTVVLDHGRGLYSVLAHMTRASVKPDQIVARGAPLGTVGATGRATAPHLHWSVRLGGARVDPAALLDLLGPPQPRR